MELLLGKEQYAAWARAQHMNFQPTGRAVWQAMVLHAAVYFAIAQTRVIPLRG